MKKVLATLLAAIMVLSLATAFAAPSPTSGDITGGIEVTQPTSWTVDVPGNKIPTKNTPATTNAGNGVAGAGEAGETEDEFVIAIDKSEEALARLDVLKQKVLDFLKEKTMIEFFPEEETATIAEGSDLTMDELFALYVANYKPELGQVKVSIGLTTPYVEGQPVYAMIGLYDSEEEITWKLVKPGVTAITEEGVEIAFEPELLTAMDNAPAVVLAILSTPAK